ncbi:MAG: hypothetical protein OEW19_08090 [Acidobacteriota bacterium]|nr:hypothetical protein [Acidobacteriota bacterium]
MAWPPTATASSKARSRTSLVKEWTSGAHGRSSSPTTPQADHEALTATGSSAALGVAVLPIALILLLWARFG